MLQKQLGQRIADLRRNRRLTQVQLAKLLDCSVEFISLVERGVNAPSVARLEDFAKVLKVEVVDLFKFVGRKPTRIRKIRISKRGGSWVPS
jgi:transcriptional regulator with XRE-family HTH domain